MRRQEWALWEVFLLLEELHGLELTPGELRLATHVLEDALHEIGQRRDADQDR